MLQVVHADKICYLSDDSVGDDNVLWRAMGGRGGLAVLPACIPIEINVVNSSVASLDLCKGLVRMFCRTCVHGTWRACAALLTPLDLLWQPGLIDLGEAHKELPERLLAVLRDKINELRDSIAASQSTTSTSGI